MFSDCPTLMKIINEIAALRIAVASFRRANKTIGLVPTMGALHTGHQALIQHANAENDVTVVSIFVNPTQFNNSEDFNSYPHQITEDIALLEKTACDILFCPRPEAVYMSKPLLTMSFGSLETTMEGKYRPGHFAGVGLIVGKLFNYIQPDRAYFGQKDLQQCAIIKQLVKDLDFDISIRVVPTVREENGLALSSRNLLLSPQQKTEAAFLYKLLLDAKYHLLQGQEISLVTAMVENSLRSHTLLKLEYFAIVNSETLQPVEHISANNISLCIAAYADKVRLIDNIYLHDNSSSK